MFPRLAAALAAIALLNCSSYPAAEAPGSPNAGSAQPGRPPNVVVILTDDMGWGDLGCYGNTVIRTPNVDRLAEGGVRLTDFYVTHPYCTPTRAALLTGRHPIRTGMTRVLFPQSPDGLDKDEHTLAKVLKAKGYATALFGKWHLGSRVEFFPTRYGFDEWYGMPWPNDQDDKHYLSKQNGWNWGPLPLYRNDRLVEQPADLSRLTERYFGEATRFITEHKNRPFFVYVPTSMPHLWLAAGEKFRGKSKHGLYGDTIEEIDYYVGELVRTLRKLNLEENTLIVFFSDNGPLTSHPQLDPKDPKGSAGPFRAGKGTTFEGGIRVPCIVRWPGVASAGTVVKQPVVVMDLFTTIVKAAAADLPRDRPIDGRDLTPVLSGTGRLPTRDLYFYSQETLQAVRVANWKLTLPLKGNPKAAEPEKRDDQPLMLFDLDADPGETTNVVTRFPDVVRDIQDRADKWTKSLGTIPKPKT
jgi:arylsulfatase A-like enzyme